VARGGFEQIIVLNLKRFQPEEVRKKHIEIARKVLNNFLERQRDKPEYEIIVDGHLAHSEEAVKPFGVIRYVFKRMAQVGKYAIKTARDMSPVQSGRYKRSWILVADGQLVSENDIPNSAKELVLVNNQPYARKIHLRGARLRGVPPGIVEKTRLKVQRQFSSVELNIRFITLGAGYRLKKDYIQTRRSGRLRLRDQAGSDLTYPALVIKQKFG